MAVDCALLGAWRDRLSPELGLLSRVPQVLFTPATQAARQAACTIVEALATIPSRKQQVLDLLTRYGSGFTWGQPSPCFLESQ